MRDWQLKSGDPRRMCIAADARLTVPNYVDDQAWEIRTHSLEPPALAIETSYGWRARSMRIFPAFHLGDESFRDPADFASEPALNLFLPNYLRLSFSPTETLRVESEYWAVESNMLAGRLTLRNPTNEPQPLQLTLHAVMHPGENPRPMNHESVQGSVVLAGSTDDIYPLVFLAGGAFEAVAPYPGLVRPVILPAGESETFIWVHTAEKRPPESLGSVRDIMQRDWDAEVARLERINSGIVDIRTGDPEWDAALATAQVAALGAFVGPTRFQNHASPVLVRSMDHGHSSHPDGRDYDVEWQGPNSIEALFLAGALMPSAPELIKGLSLNFLAAQAPDGSVPWRPGIGGQREKFLEIPLLATLVNRVHQHTGDAEFLNRAMARLSGTIQPWSEKTQDRDQDGHPEWSHTLQAGFEDWPTFASAGQGLDIRVAETPDLAAYLVSEIDALEALLEIRGDELDESLADWRQSLRNSLDRSWSETAGAYLHLDRDVHQSLEGEMLGDGTGDFVLEIDREFEPPVRVLSRGEAAAASVQIHIHGTGRTNRRRVESLTGRKLRATGASTSELPYTRIERIEVHGGQRLKFSTHDLRDIDRSCLMPLWAGAPDAGRAAKLIKKTLLKKKLLWDAAGLASHAGEGATASPMWGTMLGEGLVDYGYFDEAAELLSRMMQASVGSLNEQGGFHESYSRGSLRGTGGLHHLAGIAPVGLFLYILGVRLISSREIALRGINPFPWPIEIQWRGIEVHWVGDSATVRFPDGGQVTIEGSAVQLVKQAAKL